MSVKEIVSLLSDLEMVTCLEESDHACDSKCGQISPVEDKSDDTVDFSDIKEVY